MYNACIGQYDYVQEQVPVAPFVRDNNEFYNFSPELLDNLTASHEACGYQNFIDTYLTFPPSDVQPPLDTYPPQCDIWGRVFRELDRSTDPAVKCFNPYQISEQCPLFPDVLGRPSNFSATPYFNRTDVKRAFNVPDTISWTECSNNDVFVGPKVGGPEGGRDISIDPIQRVLPQVVEATQNVIVSNGNYDMIIITNGTLLSIQNMTWADQLGFQREPRREILLENGEVGGIQHYERGLMWAETYKVGHMGPEFSPYISYRQMQWLLGGIKHL
jgi:carboxypeptidase D